MPLNIMKEQSLTYTKTTFALQKDKISFVPYDKFDNKQENKDEQATYKLK